MYSTNINLSMINVIGYQYYFYCILLLYCQIVDFNIEKTVAYTKSDFSSLWLWSYSKYRIKYIT